MNKPSILVIDDESQIRKLLTITLQSNNYSVLEASTGKEGINSVSTHPPDLVLLDLGLPDENGHAILKHLREWFSNPIMIISVQTNEDDIVKALDNGANDYLIKPFRTGELLARIRSALRKSDSQENSPLIDCGDIHIDLSSRTVKRNNELIKLTVTEYSLLSLLAKNEGRVLTHHYLLRQIWGPGYIEQS